MFNNFLFRVHRRVLFAIAVFILIDPSNFANAQSSNRTPARQPNRTSNRPATRYGFQINPAAEAKVREAYLRSLADENVDFDDYKTMFNWLTEFSGKEKWRKIQWRHDLWDARVESAKSGKPIFIWAMNGDPLGCV